ncbi:MAG: hypothetical protein ACM3NQ_10720, partial [Bacteroidales bacterium]
LSPYALQISRDDEVHLVLLADGYEQAGSFDGQQRSVHACFQGFETDARMAHVRLSRSGAVTQATLVDGTTLRRPGVFEIEAAGRVGDLAIATDVAGAVDVFSGGRLPALRLTVPTGAPRVVRLNDQPVSFESAGSRLAVETGQPLGGTQAGAAVVVPAHGAED